MPLVTRCAKLNARRHPAVTRFVLSRADGPHTVALRAPLVAL